jgi:hypothetical protein
LPGTAQYGDSPPPDAKDGIPIATDAALPAVETTVMPTATGSELGSTATASVMADLDGDML